VVVGYLAVAAMLPNLLLTVPWITGSTIGLAAESSAGPRVQLDGNMRRRPQLLELLGAAHDLPSAVTPALP
jgi:hypothetical protein